MFYILFRGGRRWRPAQAPGGEGRRAMLAARPTPQATLCRRRCRRRRRRFHGGGGAAACLRRAVACGAAGGAGCGEAGRPGREEGAARAHGCGAAGRRRGGGGAQALSACVAGSLAVAVSLSPLAVAPAPALAADEAGGGLVGFARGYASVRLASARRAGAGWQWRSADAAVERARGREWPVQGRE